MQVELLNSMGFKFTAEYEDSSEGISLLESRNHMMIQYQMQLIYMLITRLTNCPSEEIVEELVKTKTILDKHKIVKKLQPTINKLLSETTTKPNPSAMTTASLEEDTTTKATQEVYRPPKTAPVPYITEKQKQHSTKSRMLKDLMEQYDSRPEVIEEEKDNELQEIQEFEEHNFIRRNLTKAQKRYKFLTKESKRCKNHYRMIYVKSKMISMI